MKTEYFIEVNIEGTWGFVDCWTTKRQAQRELVKYRENSSQFKFRLIRVTTTREVVK